MSVSNMTDEQRLAMADLSDMSTGLNSRNGIEDDIKKRPVEIVTSSYVDYSRDILSSNIAGRFGGR